MTFWFMLLFYILVHDHFRLQLKHRNGYADRKCHFMDVVVVVVASVSGFGGGVPLNPIHLSFCFTSALVDMDQPLTLKESGFFFSHVAFIGELEACVVCKKKRKSF